MLFFTFGLDVYILIFEVMDIKFSLLLSAVSVVVEVKTVIRLQCNQCHHYNTLQAG